jgi:hypothetical protein
MLQILILLMTLKVLLDNKLKHNQRYFFFWSKQCSVDRVVVLIRVPLGASVFGRVCGGCFSGFIIFLCFV